MPMARIPSGLREIAVSISCWPCGMAPVPSGSASTVQPHGAVSFLMVVYSMSQAGPQLLAMRRRLPGVGAGSAVGPFQVEAPTWTRSPVAQGLAVTPVLSAMDWTCCAIETPLELVEPPPPLLELAPPHAVAIAVSAATTASRRAIALPPVA